MNAEPRRIILYLLLPIGDTLFATPTIRALRHSYPRARIAAIAYPTNAGILQANPDIDRLYLYPTAETWNGARSYARFIWQLNRGKFDLAIQFGPAQWWLTQLIRPAASRHLDLPVWQWFLPFGTRHWRARHAVSSYATLLTPAELRHLPSGPVMVCTDDDRAVTATVMRAQDGGRFIAVHPGGEGFRGMKRWPLARFAAVCRSLERDFNARIVILGGRDEVEIANELARAVPGAASLAGKLSLGQTVAVLERCTVFVGNDSAPMHLASAIHVPTVAIFGPTSTTNFRPRGADVTVLRAGLACSPCLHFVGSHTLWAASRCRVPSCLHAVSTDTVVAAAAPFLKVGGRVD